MLLFYSIVSKPPWDRRGIEVLKEEAGLSPRTSQSHASGWLLGFPLYIHILTCLVVLQGPRSLF